VLSDDVCWLMMFVRRYEWNDEMRVVDDGREIETDVRD
jgi:hypothetical protein